MYYDTHFPHASAFKADYSFLLGANCSLQFCIFNSVKQLNAGTLHVTQNMQEKTFQQTRIHK
jgi:hypothetical protein